MYRQRTDLLTPDAASTTVLHIAKVHVTKKDTAERMQRSQKQAAVTGSALYILTTPHT
jgi:hypothetical protein